MKALHRKSILIAGTVALLGAGAALQSVAFAQAAPQLPEVLVEAGPVSRAVVGRSLATNAPIESITVDYRVRYSDLDLVKHADVQTLHERIEMAARDACQQLDELFPIQRSHSQTGACIEDAVRGAAPSIQQAIASVQERSPDTVAQVAEQTEDTDQD